MSRHDIRAAALRLIGERGYSAVSLGDVAADLGVTLETITPVFSGVREIITANDHFGALVTNFRDSPPQLTCAGAWLIAVDETAAEMSADEWATETLRQQVLAAEEAQIGGVVSEIVATMTELTLAVAERSGKDAGTTQVSIFVGVILGTLLSMPTSFYPDGRSWVNAHALAMESLGDRLDRLLS